MTQYNSLNVKLSISQLNKLKSAMKNETDVVLRLSSNFIANSDDETNFPHKLLLTNRQVANLHKAFANYLSTDTKLSKPQLSKMVLKMKQKKKKGFLSMLLGTLGASSLGNMLAEKGVMDLMDLHFKKVLIPPHPLTNF